MRKFMTWSMICLISLIAASWCGAAELIMNEADWIRVATSKNASTATLSLGADITLTCLLSCLPRFSGVINSNGHKITLADRNRNARARCPEENRLYTIGGYDYAD